MYKNTSTRVASRAQHTSRSSLRQGHRCPRSVITWLWELQDLDKPSTVAHHVLVAQGQTAPCDLVIHILFTFCETGAHAPSDGLRLLNLASASYLEPTRKPRIVSPHCLFTAVRTRIRCLLRDRWPGCHHCLPGRRPQPRVRGARLRRGRQE